MPLLLIAGHILNKWYQEAKLIADDIVQADDNNLQMESKGLLEYQWLEYLAQQKRELGGKSIEHDSTQPLIVHSTYGYIGGLEELIVWATQHTPDYKDPRDEPEYAAVEDELQTLADREFAAYIANATDSSFVYLDFSSASLEALASGKANAGGAPSRPGTSAGTGNVSVASSRPGTNAGRRRSIDGQSVGGDFGPHRVIIELNTRQCPKTSENFRRLCTGEGGEVAHPESGANFPLHYQNSTVHRIVKDGWIQAGDIVAGKGNDGFSATGAQFFPDENLSIPLDSAGLVCMANNGPHTNSSQFFITLRELPAFNGKNCVFGRVIFGMGTLELINTLPIKSNQRPSDPLTIVASDVFNAAMLDDNVNKWTRKRQPKKKKKTNLTFIPKAADASPRIPHKKATLFVIGFEGSGKSTIVNNLLGKPWEPTNATVGFERSSITVAPTEPGAATFDLSLWGLGGAKNIRGYWTNYVDAIHGVVFVVDASETHEAPWKELAEEFHRILTLEMVAGKPVLVYCNKQDKPGALSMTEVSMRLRADQLSATTPQIHFVKCCARTDLKSSNKATKKKQQQQIAPAPTPSPTAGDDDSASSSPPPNFGGASDVDPDIPRGLNWLLSRIAEEYLSLTERVARDGAIAKRRAKEEMEAARAKIAKQKEEREAAEAAAAAAAAAGNGN